MLETLCSSTFCLRMPHRLPLPSASLARQWSSWRCVFEVVIMLEYCPVAQSPKRGDHALLQYITVHVGTHGSLNEL